jgi:hypothetical protein
MRDDPLAMAVAWPQHLDHAPAGPSRGGKLRAHTTANPRLTAFAGNTEALILFQHRRRMSRRRVAYLNAMMARWFRQGVTLSYTPRRRGAVGPCWAAALPTRDRRDRDFPRANRKQMEILPEPAAGGSADVWRIDPPGWQRKRDGDPAGGSLPRAQPQIEGCQGGRGKTWPVRLACD